jgi:hypothetical protein
MADVYVFGDSHWRVFFPFVNHGAATDNVSHEQDGVRTIDTIANELSGATMYGLLNPNSKNGARNRILGTLDAIGGAENVGLAFGEVDARYHNSRYFYKDKISYGRLYDLVARYRRFIEEDLLADGRVRGNVFVYYGYAYPQQENTLLQPGQPIGPEGLRRAEMMHIAMPMLLNQIVDAIPRTYVITPWGGRPRDEAVSPDGVHLLPEKIYPTVLHGMKKVFEPKKGWEAPL